LLVQEQLGMLLQKCEKNLIYFSSTPILSKNKEKIAIFDQKYLN
jgi:hypothetical protein